MGHLGDRDINSFYFILLLCLCGCHFQVYLNIQDVPGSLARSLASVFPPAGRKNAKN